MKEWWLARHERHGRAAARLYARAHALEGVSRTEAARLAGMDAQTLRDAVNRLNAQPVRLRSLCAYLWIAKVAS
jgi:hypothetical protein